METHNSSEKYEDKNERDSSESLNKTLDVARGFLNNEVDYDSLVEYLDHRFKEHDSESYDCHSFVLSLLKREFGLPVITAPNIDTPDRKKYEFEVEWQEDLFKKLSEMFETEEGKLFREQNKKITENIFEHSIQVPIPHQTFSSTEDIDVNISVETAKNITDRFNSNAKSNVLLISNGHDDKFIDVHSTYVLGVDDSGEDLIVLEKEQIGGCIRISRLSEIILTYSLNFRFRELEVNICETPINKVL